MSNRIRNLLTYGIDSHSNLIVCLTALGNGLAVFVSINLSWNHAPSPMFEADMQSTIKNLLAKYGLPQR